LPMRAPVLEATLARVPEYRVGVSVSPKVERRLAWIEANRADLQPIRVGRSGDDVVRLVLSVEAPTEADAVEQAMAILDRAALMTAGGISASSLGVVGAEAWKAGDPSPADYS
jgi:hypothetical protein